MHGTVAAAASELRSTVHGNISSRLARLPLFISNADTCFHPLLTG